MKKQSDWVTLVVTMLLILLCPVLATAAESQERYWVKMNPNRFESTSESALEQCRRAASLPASPITLDQCTALKAKLDEGKCKVEMVPDGIRFDLMSTFESGRPTVVGPFTKKLGREDQASVCNVGDGVTTYFFVGAETSCGNLAFVVERPEVVEVLPAEAYESKSTSGKKCRWVKGSTAVTQEFVTTAIMPTVTRVCGGVISTSGGVFTTPLPQSSFISSGRSDCED